MGNTYYTRIKQKRDTSSNWIQNNPILLNGEIILVDTETGDIRAKIGDGITTYTQLPFADEALRDLIQNSGSGVYVGPGDMPDNCNVQIDPNGRAITIPTKVSDLDNDSGFITLDDIPEGGGVVVETDPTVPSWAKEPTKPSYNASEISYTHYNIQDTSGTIKGALDEAITYVTEVLSPHDHAHSNKGVLDKLGEADSRLTYNGEVIGGSGSALIAGDLIEIKDGIIRSTLGDPLGDAPVEEIDEIFSTESVSSMETWEDKYEYVSEETNKMPDVNKKLLIEFGLADGTKKKFSLDINDYSDSENEEDKNYAALYNCESRGEEGLLRIDENFEAFALNFFYDSGIENPPTLYMISWEDYTNASIVISQKIITTTEPSYVKLPNEALSLDSVPMEGGIKPITSGGVYDAIQDTKDEMNNAFQNLTAEDIGALPNSVVVPTKVSDLENDKNFTSFNDIMTELSEQEYAKQHWVRELLKQKQDLLIFDTEPTEGSNRPVTSGGIYAALQKVGGSGGSYELTEEDIIEIRDAVLAQLPKAEEDEF